jgi:hypothetical protein
VSDRFPYPHTSSKNPPPISGYKHTSLIFFIDGSSGVQLSSAQKMILVTFAVTLGRR